MLHTKSIEQVKLLKCNVSGAVYYINIYSIIYIESKGHQLLIKTVSADYVIRNSLKKIATYLDEQFFQIHQSYIINIHFVVAISSHEVILRGNHQIPIGRKYKNAFINEVDEDIVNS